MVALPAPSVVPPNLWAQKYVYSLLNMYEPMN